MHRSPKDDYSEWISDPVAPRIVYARPVHTDERTRALNEQIERGVLESERLRQTILSFVLVCTIPVVYTTLNSGKHLSKNVDSRIFDGLILATVMASSIIVVYGWTTRYVIDRMLATGRRMPRFARFFNSLVEALLVTCLSWHLLTSWIPFSRIQPRHRIRISFSSCSRFCNWISRYRYSPA